MENHGLPWTGEISQLPSYSVSNLYYYFYERLKDDINEDGSDFDLVFDENLNNSMFYDIQDIVKAAYINDIMLKKKLIWTPSYHYKVHSKEVVG